MENRREGERKSKSHLLLSGLGHVVGDGAVPFSILSTPAVHSVTTH